MSTETLSIRIDSAMKEKLEALAEQTQRSKSFLAAEAIAAYVELESWQIGEIRAGIAELDAKKGIDGDAVRKSARVWIQQSGRKSKR
jgi:RHH-type transcriptional regulator, rel operon repressor / antitoxin RelB